MKPLTEFMKNTSHISILDFHEPQMVELLRVLTQALTHFNIDFFLVGAFARDIHMHSSKDFIQRRRTKDIDLAILIADERQFQNLKSYLIQQGSFKGSPTEPIRLIFTESIEVDLLPFGLIQNEKGETILAERKDFVLEMPGFKEIYPYAKQFKTVEGINLKVSTLPGIVLLKLLAWQDRPERKKDIEDIDYIFQHFYLLQVEDIVTEHGDLLDAYEISSIYTELVSARFIGRQIGEIFKNNTILKDRIIRLLQEETSDIRKNKIPRLMHHEETEEAVKVLKALLDGIEDIA